jgi:hypothetical protein
MVLAILLAKIAERLAEANVNIEYMYLATDAKFDRGLTICIRMMSGQRKKRSRIYRARQ